MKKAGVLIRLTLLMVVILTTVFAVQAREYPPAAFRVDPGLEARALALLNADRAAHGLPPLRENPQLSSLAREYGKDMITRSFFSHYNPEGLSPFDRMDKQGINYNYAGENLAINVSVEEAEVSLMNSDSHRKNILNTHFSEIGIGVCVDETGAVYVVQEFIGE